MAILAQVETVPGFPLSQVGSRVQRVPGPSGLGLPVGIRLLPGSPFISG